MNRRSIIVLLIGVIATLTGFAVAAFMGQNRCLDAGGSWNSATRTCRLVTGEMTGMGFSAIIIGVVVGILLALMLHRAVQFFAIRSSPPQR